MRMFCMSRCETRLPRVTVTNTGASSAAITYANRLSYLDPAIARIPAAFHIR